MDYESIRRIIDNNKDKVNFGDIGDGAADEWIENAQYRLNVRFPPSYIWWLQTYKGGEINGEEIFSVYDPRSKHLPGGDIVYVNELQKKFGFFVADHLVIQSNDFGEDYYFDLSQVDADGENPIYVSPGGIKYASNFLDFLKRKIEEVCP